MKQLLPLPKIAAVISSLLLVGTYVWYGADSDRSGPNPAAEAGEQSRTIVSTSTPTQQTSARSGAKSTVDPSGRLLGTEPRFLTPNATGASAHFSTTSRPGKNRVPTLETEEIPTPSSNFDYKVSLSLAPPTEEQSEARSARTLMPGSKSAPIVPPRRATNQPSRILMHGTKAATRVIQEPVTTNSPASRARSNSSAAQSSHPAQRSRPGSP